MFGQALRVPGSWIISKESAHEDDKEVRTTSHNRPYFSGFCIMIFKSSFSKTILQAGEVRGNFKS